MGYRCPSCGTNDPHQWQGCYQPDCPDGRDRGNPHRGDNRYYSTNAPTYLAFLALLMLFVLLAFLTP